MSGNQYTGRKAAIMAQLDEAREYLRADAPASSGMTGLDREGCTRYAAALIGWARLMIDAAPASTRRRWACGR